MGPPASGKSSYCTQRLPGYTRINQDQLRTLQKCQQAARCVATRATCQSSQSSWRRRLDLTSSHPMSTQYPHTHTHTQITQRGPPAGGIARHRRHQRAPRPSPGVGRPPPPSPQHQHQHHQRPPTAAARARRGVPRPRARRRAPQLLPRRQPGLGRPARRPVPGAQGDHQPAGARAGGVV